MMAMSYEYFLKKVISQTSPYIYGAFLCLTELPDVLEELKDVLSACVNHHPRLPPSDHVYVRPA